MAIPKEIQKQADAYLKSFKDLTKAYGKKAMELKKGGPPQLELAQPTSGTWPLYPWWNIFLIGPIQIPGDPHQGPFLPSKIIDHNNEAYMITIVWRNPFGINWEPNTPSACQVMNDRDFQINFEVLNITRGQEGPDLQQINGTFPNAPDCLQVFVTRIENFPQPQQGKPDLYNLYATIDIIGAEQPMAGFATWVLDLDIEPSWLYFPTRLAHFHYEEPVHFMVYNR